MVYQQAFILSLFLFFNLQGAEERIVYHRIYTGSNEDRPIVVDSWNDDTGRKQIRETVDGKNRVKKIEFLRDGELSEYGNFPVALVTYEYIDNTIVETAYDKHEKNIYVDKYAAHYQSIYYLNPDGFIEDVKRISDFETVDPVWVETGIERPTQAQLEQESQEYFDHFYKDKPFEVEFYKYSFHKLDGVYPVSENYSVDTNYEKEYMDTSMEQGIIDGVIKLYQSKTE
jgi:hypothetical protein